jgi:hypothetical protein
MFNRFQIGASASSIPRWPPMNSAGDFVPKPIQRIGRAFEGRKGKSRQGSTASIGLWFYKGRVRIVLGSGPIKVVSRMLWKSLAVRSGHVDHDDALCRKCINGRKVRNRSFARTAAPNRNGEGSMSVPYYRVQLASKCLGRRWRKFVISKACKQFTKSAQSSGPENIAPERPLPGFLAAGAALSISCIIF